MPPYTSTTGYTTLQANTEMDDPGGTGAEMREEKTKKKNFIL